MSQVFIGIDDNTSALYEGSPSLYGHAIWPTPFLSIASYIGPQSEWIRRGASANIRTAEMVFREDSFDPVARVRRGRLYYRFTGMNPATWHVQRHPAYMFADHQNHLTLRNSTGSGPSNGYGQKSLITFCSWVADEALVRNRRNLILVLGAGDRTTTYVVLDVERLITGEELITVRTRASLGVLPDLIVGSVPEGHAPLVMEQYEKAASSAFRDDAEGVVDRCREAATAALNAERSRAEGRTIGGSSKDLAELASYFSDEAKFGPRGGMAVLSNAARIIARLHSRGKSAERAKNGTDGLSEGDAECALALLGTIYRELKWDR